MIPHFAYIFPIFVLIVIFSLITIGYYKFINSPECLEKLELQKFRENLYPGIYVKLEDSNLRYKVVLVCPDYVRLHHPSKGFSGHPVTSLYPVDYEF